VTTADRSVAAVILASHHLAKATFGSKTHVDCVFLHLPIFGLLGVYPQGHLADISPNRAICCRIFRTANSKINSTPASKKNNTTNAKIG